VSKKLKSVKCFLYLVSSAAKRATNVMCTRLALLSFHTHLFQAYTSANSIYTCLYTGKIRGTRTGYSVSMVKSRTDCIVMIRQPPAHTHKGTDLLCFGVLKRRHFPFCTFCMIHCEVCPSPPLYPSSHVPTTPIARKAT
jgi:hypothetical protein